MTIRLLSIFFFMMTINNKNINKQHKVIIIPMMDLEYKFAPIETHIIMPGILEIQYIESVL